MSTKEARFQAQYRYAAKNLKRVPLDLKISDYESVKAAATAAGESVNGYIKEAIRERQARDAVAPAGQPSNFGGGETSADE